MLISFGPLKKIYYSKVTQFLFNAFKYGVLTFVIMFVINHASLSKEKEANGTHGLTYDIGMGQKIFMSCKGEGLPTIIMDSAIGLNSDIYLNLQAKLASLTKVII